MKTYTTSPWEQTLGLLKRLSSTSDVEERCRAAATSSKKRRVAHESILYESGKFVVRVIERTSFRTIKVAWSDSTSCCYGDQLWRIGVARHAGSCVVSGQRINRGDAIYKPLCKPDRPRNADAMILCSVMDDVLPDFEEEIHEC